MVNVEFEARGILATEPAGNYERWALEIFRRRFAKAKENVEVAEAEYKEAAKGGTFTKEEAAAHTKRWNEACTRQSITRAWLSELVRDIVGELEFAKKLDKWAAEDPEWKFAALPGSAEEKRDKALEEAAKIMESDINDVIQYEIGFSRIEGGRRRGCSGRKRAIVEAYEKRVAEIEEEYYATRM